MTYGNRRSACDACDDIYPKHGFPLSGGEVSWGIASFLAVRFPDVGKNILCERDARFGRRPPGYTGDPETG